MHPTTIISERNILRCNYMTCEWCFGLVITSGCICQGLLLILMIFGYNIVWLDWQRSCCITTKDIINFFGSFFPRTISIEPNSVYALVLMSVWLHRFALRFRGCWMHERISIKGDWTYTIRGFTISIICDDDRELYLSSFVEWPLRILLRVDLWVKKKTKTKLCWKLRLVISYVLLTLLEKCRAES